MAMSESTSEDRRERIEALRKRREALDNRIQVLESSLRTAGFGAALEAERVRRAPAARRGSRGPGNPQLRQFILLLAILAAVLAWIWLASRG